MKLWEYESGRKLQSCDLKELEETLSSEADDQKVTTDCSSISVVTAAMMSPLID